MFVTRTDHRARTRALIERRLGFVPEESVVLAAIHTDGRDGMAARFDLDSLADPAHRTRLIALLAAPLRTARPDAVAVAYYTHGGILPLAAIDADITALLGDLGLLRHATILVDTPVTGPRRADLGIITSASTARRQAVHRALDATAETSLDTYRAAVAFAAAGVTVPAPLLGAVAAWFTDPAHRDAAVALITGAPEAHARRLEAGDHDDDLADAVMDRLFNPLIAAVPTSDVAAHRAVLTEVVACSPPRHQVAPRTLLALIAWWSGQGALAARHLEEARTIEATDRLAVLLQQVLDAGLPPGWVSAEPS
ncbi:DUF4192 family protein [Georgenia sp. AZ-5]|uniref:DUF4192 family protein n=1 Tax=Georgenia sp. AZ-5 TaxID=3367526 RepID=UPI0037546973